MSETIKTKEWGQCIMRGLPPKERRILAAMARHKARRFSDIVRAARDFEKTHTATCLCRLVDKGVLKRARRGEYEFRDKIFEKWLQTHNS